MKLIIILPLVAACYAAKLDRTYLPPENAGSAGGSPGSLTAPSQNPQGISGTNSYSQNGGLGSERNYGGSSRLSNPGNIGQANNGVATNDFSSLAGSTGQNEQDFGFKSGISPTVGSNQEFESMQRSDISQQRYAPERPQAAAEMSAEILRYVNENDGETFSYSFETSNGISAEESGVATNGVKAQGAFSYTGDDGNGYSITYTADENGYQPQGDHLPTPHPIPEEILKSIEENMRAAAAGVQEGAYRPEEYENDNTSQQYNQVQNSQAQGPYNYEQPSTTKQQGRPNFPGQTGTNGQLINQQSSQAPSISAYRTQQGQSSTVNKGSPNLIGQTKAQFNEIQNNGYNYNKPQPQFNQAINSHPVAQNSFTTTQSSPVQFNSANQKNIPSAPNTQISPNQKPSFNVGESAYSSTRPFSSLKNNERSPNAGKPVGFTNQIGHSTPITQSEENRSGYRYDRPQTTQYKETLPFDQQSSSVEIQRPTISGQSSVPLTPVTNTFVNQKPSFDIGASTYPESTPKTSTNQNPQSFGSRAIESTKQPNKGSVEYNYEKPQFNQFTPGKTLFNQEISGNARPRQHQSSAIPSRSSQVSSNIGAPRSSGSAPSFTYLSPKNQQSFDSRPDELATQRVQPKAEIGHPEQNKGLNGYNYDKPQSNGNVFSQVPLQYSQNNQAIPSDPNSQTFDNQRQINGGLRPITSLDDNLPSAGANRFSNTQRINDSSNQNQAMTQDSSLIQAPYQYNRPTSTVSSQRPNFASQVTESSRIQTQSPLVKSEQFGGPRQPPSFSPEEGYKY